MRLPEGVESIRAFARRVLRTHPTILQAIEEGRIKAIYCNEAEQLRGVYWQDALAEYSANTDPTQAERTGAAPLNAAGATENPRDGMGATPSERSPQGSESGSAGQPA